MNCRAKRLECVQLAGAVVRRGEVQKREQAPRTPNASRSSVVTLPRYNFVLIQLRFLVSCRPAPNPAPGRADRQGQVSGETQLAPEFADRACAVGPEGTALERLLLAISPQTA